MSNYYMKDKKDEKRMEEHITKNVNAIKNSIKYYKKIISQGESYVKADQTFANNIKQFSESLVTQSQTGIEDLDQGINNVVNIFMQMYAGRMQTASFFSEKIIPNMKKNAESYPVMVKNFETRYANDMKRNEQNISSAEKRIKSNKNDMLKIMEEIKQAEALRQQSIVQGLQDTTKMVRDLYCNMIQLFVDLFEKEKQQLQQVVDILNAKEAEMRAMANARTNYGEEVGELLKAKKQTLINLKLLSPELKKVLKDAGLKRKDLCNPETVQLLITVVSEAVAQGKCDESVLEQLTAHQLARREGLDNVVVDAKLKAVDPIVFLASCGKHDNGCV